ncbi:MAG: 30S ribosomal protein S8 [Chloroflexi bacterium]|nr:30S ribosomal protein S8 [Chloroflexota bacterium]
MMTDPIADMLTRTRNAITAKHKQVTMPSANTKVALARILKDEGFIRGYDVADTKPQATLRLHLKYDEDRKPIITDLQRVSKPGRRVYTSRHDIPWVRSGLGVTVMSTPKGVMTGREARRAGVGGEVVAYIW